jgi:hypothetical protein
MDPDPDPNPDPNHDVGTYVIFQYFGSEFIDPDPHKKVMDPQH